ncbi:Rab11 family-interacting protein 4 [Amphibalanus amphitrite]|uniref:Rab11 family-interacting protein 4 n=1 Tax=Amphibalanus amphitrite TaxID=1232801 RepID=A0A6A4VP88_AMPAM|nr:Rab11 family-interacting protein 4 [Amphibalanus amphitrite]KAF0294710.1 Rab11 family-interacting protein 4 [Amphibalanus amphitrite]
MARSCSSVDHPDLDSGLEDDLVSSVGDVRSVSDLELDTAPVTRARRSPPVSPHLKSFLRAMRTPKLCRTAEGGYELAEGGEGKAEEPDLEWEWWEGQCSFLGAGVGEGDVFSWHLDTMEKVHVLERQVTVLAENQNNNDDRYTRSKEENAALQARLIMLEEQELIQRLEREKTLELENQSIRLQSLEKEVRFAETEAARARQQLESVCAERASQEERLAQLTASLETARQESRSAVELERRGREQLEQERAAQSQMMSELSSELADTRQQASLRLKTESDEAGLMRLRQTELEAELRQLRQQNRELQESHDELQAQLLSSGLQEGRQLLESGPKSLALELEDLSGEQLKKSLLEQQEVNKQLRAYIDGILLNIVENHPQLLEVKQHP